MEGCSICSGGREGKDLNLGARTGVGLVALVWFGDFEDELTRREGRYIKCFLEMSKGEDGMMEFAVLFAK